MSNINTKWLDNCEFRNSDLSDCPVCLSVYKMFGMSGVNVVSISCKS